MPLVMRVIGPLLWLACLAFLASTGAAGQGERQGYAVESAASAGLSTSAVLSLVDEQLLEYGRSFKQLRVDILPETESRLHVRIEPVGQQRWEVPESIIPRPGATPNLDTTDVKYDVERLLLDDTFDLKITRKPGRGVVFDTTGHRFAYKDQYIELTTTLPEDSDVYGLGEVTLPTGLLLPRNGSTFTMWTRDISAAVEGANLYGAHPFHLQVNQDGFSHGVLFLNSNGMDITLAATSLTYKVIGGIVDLYFFLGPTPEEVIQQYHQVIGKPALPPYWSLGLHQSRWGYPNLEVLQSVVANYSAAGLPLEVIWSDIDYMHTRFRNAEFDPLRFPVNAMSSFVEDLQSRGQHWVPIIDAGIAASAGYQVYADGSRDSVWIQDYKGNPYVGQVWPGPAVYPDYLHSETVGSWLQQKMDRFHSQVPYSGLWLDMNEASNFCSGISCEVDRSNATASYWLDMAAPKDGNMTVLVSMLSTCMMKCEAAADDNTLAHPPYKLHNWGGPNFGDRVAPLGQNIISPTAMHTNGALEYDAHNLFGTAMAKSHYEAVEAVTGKRPFLLSRSTFPGAGRYTAHWTGDNAANWENLYYSIAGIINSNLWGMPMVGADICGFIDSTQNGDPWSNPEQLPAEEYEQLCSRWASAGAFYPFSRNHMGYFARSHEYYRWESVTAAAKKAYSLRYRLLTYLYSNLYLSHASGGTVVKPLFFTNPVDREARNATKQWLMGESVLVTPVLTPDTTEVDAYFTAGKWYSAWDYQEVDAGTSGQTVQLQIPQGDIAVHYRGGSIVPLQQYAPVTRDVRYTPVTLVVALPAVTASLSSSLPPYINEEVCNTAHSSNSGSLVACGVLFMDSEEDAPLVSTDNTVQVWFTAVTAADGRSGTIKSSVISNAGGASGRIQITAVHILGVQPRNTTATTVTSTGPVVLATAAAFDAPSTEGTAALASGRKLSESAATPASAAVSIDGVARSSNISGIKYDAGVLKISGLAVSVGASMQVSWSI